MYNRENVAQPTYIPQSLNITKMVTVSQHGEACLGPASPVHAGMLLDSGLPRYKEDGSEYRLVISRRPCGT